LSASDRAETDAIKETPMNIHTDVKAGPDFLN